MTSTPWNHLRRPEGKAGLCLALAGALAMLVPALPSAVAAPVSMEDSGAVGATGLPLPRFVSLGASRVNMRAGPSREFPVTWQYVREGMPVEIIREYNQWRQIRDLDGTEGWVNGNLLRPLRFGVVTGGERKLYSAPDQYAQIVWRVETGVVGRLVVCEEAWCQFSVDGKTGWIPREHVWGTYANENFN